MMIVRTTVSMVTLLLLLMLAEASLGKVQETFIGRQYDPLIRQVKGQGSSLHRVPQRSHGKDKNIAAKYSGGSHLDRGLVGHLADLGYRNHSPHRGHVVKQSQGHDHGYQNPADQHGRTLAMVRLHQTGKTARVTGRRWLRVRRATPAEWPRQVTSGGVRLPQGVTYAWTRDVGAGRTFDEAAFKSKDKNVVVILSFDDALKDSNLTASATLYDFTGTSGVMAIKPRRRPGPCFLVDTSLTYDKIIEELSTRNGSSVSTSTVISLDGTGNPVSVAERQAMLKKTPSLSRQCRGREIIRTRRIGFPSIPSDGQTKELKVLTLDTELSITVPVDLNIDAWPFRQWFQGGLKGQNQVKNGNSWKTQ